MTEELLQRLRETLGLVCEGKWLEDVEHDRGVFQVAVDTVTGIRVAVLGFYLLDKKWQCDYVLPRFYVLAAVTDLLKQLKT